MATVSTHNGSRLSQRHNRREEKIVSKEEHIDPKGQHEEWLDIDVKKAYEDIFQGSVEEYNARQKRKDRQILSYYDKIEQDKMKHVAYEMIVGVYGEDSTPEQKKQILWDFANGWKERNPNLKMIGCYWHNDEEGEQHIHIDYIPIAQCDRGMKLQNSLDRALSQQGIECGTSIHETRQINWQKRENETLRELCREREIEVETSQFSRRHEDTSAYKRMMINRENRELQEKNKALEEQAKKQQEINERNQKALQQQVKQHRELQAQNQALQASIKKGKEELSKVKDDYIDEIHQYASEEAKEQFKRELEW